MSKNDGGSNSRFVIGRRDFLVLSSTAALGVAASGLGSEMVRMTGAARPFALGFTEDVLTPSSQGTYRLVAAESLQTAHRDFKHGLAKVTVHGFWSEDTRPNSVALAAYFDDNGTDVPFLAWALSKQGGAARSTFRVPARADGSLALGFESRRPLDHKLAEVRDRLGIAKSDALIDAAANADSSNRCAVKLRRGTYVVAFDAKPSWRSLQLTAGDKSPLTIAGITPAPFDYLLLSIEHA